MLTGKLVQIFKILHREYRVLYSQNVVHETVQFGAVLSLAGGFLDAYTYIIRGGVFANAQTGNFVLLGVFLAMRDWGQALAHVPPILAFVAGVFAAEWVKKSRHRFFTLDWERKILIFELAVFIAVGFMSQSVPNNIVTVALAFAASVQVSSFRQFVDSPYSAAMSSGNLRKVAQAAYTAFAHKDFASAVRAVRFIIIILSFISGAVAGALLSTVTGVQAVWIAAVVVVFAFVMLSMCDHQYKKQKKE